MASARLRSAVTQFFAARPQEDGKAALVLGLAEGTSELRIERLQGPDLVYDKVAVALRGAGARWIS